MLCISDYYQTGVHEMGAESKLSAAELAAYDAETVKLIGEAAQLIREREGEHDTLAAEKSEAKKAVDEARDQLTDLIAERNRGRGRRPQKNLIDVLGENPKWKGKYVVTIKSDVSPACYSKILANAESLGDLATALADCEASGLFPYGMDADEVADAQAALREVVAAELEGRE